MRLKYYKHSTVIFVSRISETQVSEAQRTEICWMNYPLCKTQRDIPGAKHPEGHLRRRGI
jgi:hypothetical protein